ncbi:3450_t:CDS:2, partial [Scutellospora calospora]
HYNQIITKPSFIKQLADKSSFLNLDKSERKRLKFSNKKIFVDFGTQVNLAFIDFGIQVNLASVDFGVQVSLPDPTYENLLKQISKLESTNKQLLLAEQNLIVVKFIKTLTYNENEQQQKEKLFKNTVAIDTIYRSKYLKYVSAINLTTLAIKYLLARSKMIVDINNHIISSDPWLHSELTQKQYKELFYLILDIENKIHEELTNYLSIILEELCIEKKQETNVINNLICNQSQAGCIKKCSVCNTSNINNKKQVCSIYCNRLLMITEINQQFDESANIVNTNKKSLVINSYIFGELSKQYLAHEVYTSQVFIPDLIGVNSNSIAKFKSFLNILKKYLELRKIIVNRL